MTMSFPMDRTGLRYNNKAITPGAQTERLGYAGPVRAWLGGLSSPAAFLSSCHDVALAAVFIPRHRRYTTFWVRPSSRRGAEAMTLTVEAIYEDGVLKPAQPLPLREQERVQITIAPKTNWVQETYGICGWKGSAEEAERFATDPELDFPPPPEQP